MLIQLELGKVRLNLDWEHRRWAVETDPLQAWQRICYSDHGLFDSKDWGVIWLWDQLHHNTVIIRDSPRSEIDFRRQSGPARLFDPRERTLKDKVVRWRRADFDSVPAPSGSLRNYILQRLMANLPCSYLDKKFRELTGEPKDGTTTTNCFQLGTAVAKFAAEYRGLKGKDLQSYVEKTSLNGMSKTVRTRGLKANAWVYADLVKRPLPGDFFGLLYEGKTDRVNGEFSHVGAIQTATGSIWTTMDFGQGNSGFDGWKDNARVYNETTGTLTGNGTRVLAGWVDIDKYFP